MNHNCEYRFAVDGGHDDVEDLNHSALRLQLDNGCRSSEVGGLHSTPVREVKTARAASSSIGFHISNTSPQSSTMAEMKPEVQSASNIEVVDQFNSTSPEASKSTSASGVIVFDGTGRSDDAMTCSSRDGCFGKQAVDVFETLRRGGDVKPRHGWLAKSPKSYWLRRHSDSLLVAEVVSDQQVLGRPRQWSQADSYILDDAIESDSVSDRQVLFKGDARGSAPPLKRLVEDGRNVEPSGRSLNQAGTSSKMDFQFDYDDAVFDDEDESPFKNAQAASNCYMPLRQSLSDGSSLLDDVTSSPLTTVFVPTTLTTDEIAMRLEKLQSADRRLSRSQRSSGVDDQSSAALPRIMEEREERTAATKLISHLEQDRGGRKNYPVQMDFRAADDVRKPTPLSSLVSGANLDLGETERAHRQSVCMDLSAEELITTTTTDRHRSITSSSSGSSDSRQVRHRMSPISMNSAAATGVDSSSGTKLHRCSVCRRSFARSDMLERHARLHTGVRPYACRLCSQVFSRSDHLTTHLRTHTGEKPYQCPTCSYSASRRDMVTRHLRVHVHDNRVVDNGNNSGHDASITSNLLSPVTVGGSVGGRRRQIRVKKRERNQHRAELGPGAVPVSKAAPLFTASSALSTWSPQTSKSCVSTDDVGLVGSSTSSCPPSSMRRQPLWISSSNCADSRIKVPVDQWTPSMLIGCLASPSPMRSPSVTSFRRGDEATITSAGLSMILARGSTGSTDSYSSPGCGSDVFEFGGLAAEGSPDVFRSPAATARQTLKFLWPLVTPPTSASPESTSSYDASAN